MGQRTAATTGCHRLERQLPGNQFDWLSCCNWPSAVGLASASGFDNPNLPVASVCFTALQKAELRRVAGATLLASQRKIPAYGRARVSINRLLFGSYRDDPDWRW
jgi:hypothetical protein